MTPFCTFKLKAAGLAQTMRFVSNDYFVLPCLNERNIDELISINQGPNSVASKIWQNMVEDEQEPSILWQFDDI